IGPPTVLGDRSFFSRRLPEQEHPQFCVTEADGTERVLIDPSTLSDDHTTTLDTVSLSKEGDRLAYTLSEGGNEESVMRVMDVATGEVIDGPIDRTRYGTAAFLPGGESYFYVRRLAPEDVPEGEDLFHRRVYLHKVGTDPGEDELIFGEAEEKTAYFGVSTSRDGRWLAVSVSLGTAPRNDLYLADLAGDRQLKPVQKDVDAQTYGTVHTDGRLYIFTNLDAPKGRLVVADPQAPTSEHWVDLLPETDDVLTDYTLTDDAVVAVRQHDVVSQITVHDLQTGEARTTVDLPGLGSANVSSRPEGGHEVWIGYTDDVTPFQVLHYDVATGQTKTWAEAPGAVSAEGISAKQVFFTSKDGTQIPMFVIARDDIELDGQRPTILYGYGGFNIAMEPGYSSNVLGWVEQGGVYAIANLRGGSEYGEEWHRAGMRANKQNVFDDFIGAGEWLVANRYTSPDHLGISGGSNGGLLVGAALTQRPDLFRSVVCSAPLLDMVRYEQFSIGRTWNDEYGTADDPDELQWLLGYSPYHHVHEGTEYPAVLFTSFDSDSRTDPCHARKMCAALQWATTAVDRPILFRREAKVGHAARSITRTIDLSVDTFTWNAAQLGLKLPD
ncbi:MAG: prolyl oligopeptidase, partial [Actinomycetota bacterium]|nr:prolyl oligopeptidase [Actinomycetota bacterium]